jgi:hypothetical protein
MRTDDLICMMAKTPPCCCTKRNTRIWVRITALFLAFLAVVYFTLGFRPDLALMAYDPAMMFKYAFLAAVMVGSGIAWWYSGHPQCTYRISFFGLIFLGVFLPCLALVVLVKEGFSGIDTAVFSISALQCIGFIVGFAAIGAFTLASITKCMAPTNLRFHAFMTALFAASMGALAYGLHCSHDHPLYITLWYAGTALVFTLAALPLLMKKQSW